MRGFLSARATSRRDLLPRVLAALAIFAFAALMEGCATPSGSPVPRTTTAAGVGTLNGRIAAPGAGAARTSGDVAAISLVDATITAAAATDGGEYTLAVPAGPYLVVARTSGLGARAPATSGTLYVGGGMRLAVPPLSIAGVPVAVEAPAQGLGGSVVGMGSIGLSGPSGYGLGSDASGALVTGMLDECRKRGKKMVDLSDETREAVTREQQLSDQGRLSSPIHVTPTSSDVNIEGNVTVAEDGTPLVDLTLRDARTGEVLRHIVLRGDPGDADDIGRFLRRLGPGLASQTCETPPPPTPDASTATPDAEAPAPGQVRIVVSGPGSLDFFLTTDNVRRVCPPTCSVPVTQFRADVGVQRSRNLPPDEEAGARMIAWGGACRSVNALTEPRGGVCKPAVDPAGLLVQATFEQRPKLTLEATGAQTSSSFYLEVSPKQPGSGEGVRFECRTPPCQWSYFYNRGSTVLVLPDGTQAIRRWGGACAGSKGADEQGGLPEPCTLTMTSDTTATIQFSTPRCRSDGSTISCTFDPP